VELARGVIRFTNRSFEHLSCMWACSLACLSCTVLTLDSLGKARDQLTSVKAMIKTVAVSKYLVNCLNADCRMKSVQGSGRDVTLLGRV